MNGRLKKTFSVILSLGFSVFAPFSVYCAGDNKMPEEKKPFKRQVEKTKVLKSKNINKFKIYPKKILPEVTDFNNMHFDNPQIFETGSFGIKKFNKVLKNNRIGPNENIWKKEIFPLEDKKPGDSSDKAEGIKFVLTHKVSGRQIIFQFRFGNISFVKSRAEYCFDSECNLYQKFMAAIRKLNPENPEQIKDRLDVKSLTVLFKIENIKEFSFASRNKLSFIEFNNNINSIGIGAFLYCRDLKHIIFKGKVRGIEKCAFANCTNLEEIELPEGLIFIGSNCFKNCYSLKKVVIPATTEVMYLNAFEGAFSDLKVYYLGKEYNTNDFFKAFVAHGGSLC